MAMAHFRPVRTIFCLQQLVSAEAVNFSKKTWESHVSGWCLGRVSGVSRACLGVSRDGVSGCLGVTRGGVSGKKHDLHFIIHNKTD